MGRVLHLDVIIIGVVVIIGMTTQNQQDNVVIVINVYAKQKQDATNAQKIHITTKKVARRIPYIIWGRGKQTKNKQILNK